MAKVKVQANNYNELSVLLDMESETLLQYDHYVLNIYQTIDNADVLIYSSPVDIPNSAAETDCVLKATVSSNSEDFLIPECDYKVSVLYGMSSGYDSNELELSAETQITTDTPIAPTGSIAYTFQVPVRDQWNETKTYEYETCVSQSLACGMDIRRAMMRGDTNGAYELFSASYIYGSETNNTNEGMVFASAAKNAVTYGSPRYEIYTGRFPDNATKASSINWFNKYSSAWWSPHSLKQCWDNYELVSFYNTEKVKYYIATYGYFMFNFVVPTNFYAVSSSGIVSQPVTAAKSASGSLIGHSIALVGLTTISGKPHWIAQNSWGTIYGNSGMFYIPYDWGAGCPIPGSGMTTWVCPSYGFSSDAVLLNTPSTPRIVSAKQILSDTIEKKIEVAVDWDFINDTEYQNAYFWIFARQYNSRNIYQDRMTWYTKKQTWLTANSEETSTGKTVHWTMSIPVDDAETYEIMVLIANGETWSFSNQSNRVSVVVSDKSRPEDWNWITNISSDFIIPYNETYRFLCPVTASEWTQFTARINDFLIYLGKDPYSFTQVYGPSNLSVDKLNINNFTDFTPSIYNEAVAAIQYTGYGQNLKTSANHNNVLSANLFLSLSDALNSIP